MGALNFRKPDGKRITFRDLDGFELLSKLSGRISPGSKIVHSMRVLNYNAVAMNLHITSEPNPVDSAVYSNASAGLTGPQGGSTWDVDLFIDEGPRRSGSRPQVTADIEQRGLQSPSSLQIKADCSQYVDLLPGQNSSYSYTVNVPHNL